LWKNEKGFRGSMVPGLKGTTERAREGDGDEAKKKEFPHNGSCGAAFMRNGIILE